jgi:hypothetical protein
MASDGSVFKNNPVNMFWHYSLAVAYILVSILSIVFNAMVIYYLKV